MVRSGRKFIWKAARAIVSCSNYDCSSYNVLVQHTHLNADSGLVLEDKDRAVHLFDGEGAWVAIAAVVRLSARLVKDGQPNIGAAGGRNVAYA